MESTTFVLFGATGDLAKRKIYPALYNLFVDQKLPHSFSVIGLGRRELSDEAFQANVEQSLRMFSRREVKDPVLVKKFLRTFRYSVLDVSRKEDYQKLLQLIEQQEAELRMAPNRMFYLSVGPEFFETIAANIQESGLGSADGWKRLVIEKPFGHDLQSARALNNNLSKAFTEDEIFRIDHYLGKPMVQKLEVLQQSNPVLQALWDNRYIANVQITANEIVGVEERAGYYDHVGAVRDMFQNHMLQLLMMLTIHLPNNSTSENVRFKKKLVMEALELLQKEDLSSHVVRGQYGAGTIQGKPVIGYNSEPNIAATSRNDTFIAVKLQIDDYSWRGVPFYIRTGKRMKDKSTRIVIEFKEPLKQSKANDDTKKPNLLVIEISPNESISLQLNTRNPQNKGEFKPMHIDFHESGDNVPEAYENLIGDALHGDSTFFAHWDEVELSWQWVQPILDAYEENRVPLHLYAAGSNGPAESDELLAQDGYHWWFDEMTEQQIETKEGEQYAYHTNN
ncbi:glucose-6-phosphate 1-dehydrogenase [Paenibacillus baekrokdamisoli]|uniref:Glucose-6-phosphate 1-dehydrogenase n=1 Tax=Paenibacillus baekrokdamisoli TaxID=1712516 RepID=A0A3G9J316_9BACL|nr:glucose-6-phosphate dehydrogenase [Paenibacillus baekrokdamisoli]MBB3073242.1 glucose-6-phosphate 1-dehydrogenase [Paenibacillus baekrokdamisoli]BBH20211.1 glucose-6-phosphate 1-dehydrogenase [Paenibacillus baekrokdamisoli]